MGSIRNIVSPSDGWLRVRTEPSGDIISVPEHLRVEFSNTSGERDYFTVMEGVHKGMRCSVKSGNLSPGAIPLRPAVQLVLSKSEGVLSCGPLRVGASMAPHNKIPDGTHPIQLPDFPHPGGRRYMDEARCAKSWFLVGYGHAVRAEKQGLDRYLHTGMLSDGCITIDPVDWNAVYELIIKCRSNDGKNVGTLLVRK